MLDLKVIQSVIQQLEEDRGIPQEKTIEAITQAFATAYKKEYGKRGQIIRAHLNMDARDVSFEQVMKIVDPSETIPEDEDRTGEDDERIRFDAEKHILLADAQKIKKDAEVGGELIFPLEAKDDFGRIAAQTAKQTIIQKIRDAEKDFLSDEYGKREGEIVTGTVQRIERGNIFIDLGRATGILPYDEQIPGERYKQGERVRAYLFRVDESARGVFLKLSRSHPAFLRRLFESESPEVANGAVEVMGIAREAGSRSKIAVFSHDPHVDPVGALVGQRGVRVSTVMSELGGEKVDIIEWSEDPAEYIEEALSPAQILAVEIVDEENRQVVVRVAEDQQSLAIGKGGQNVRLAHKLTGWHIDIQQAGSDTEEDDNSETEARGQNTNTEKADASSIPEEDTEMLQKESLNEVALNVAIEVVDEQTPTTPAVGENKITDETMEKTADTAESKTDSKQTEDAPVIEEGTKE
jgi:N utilization substance protein A